jgi:hypothetical protein
MISKIGQILSLAGIIALAACGDDATTTAPVTTNACTTPVSASAQVTVTSPNCGGTWKVGDTISFAWKVGSDFGTAKVQLKLPNGHSAFAYAGGSLDTTTYKWAVPDSIYDDVARAKVSTIGSGYRLVISDYVTSSYRDTSDVAFAIVAK